MSDVPSCRSAAAVSARALAFELSELKRQYCHEDELSVAGDLFRKAWAMLSSGAAVCDVCHHVTAAAIAGTGLGSLRLATLASLLPDEWRVVALRAFDASAPLPARRFREALHAAPASATEPRFVASLLQQPRAGATAPGKPRLTLLPQENHGEHCLAVAALGAVLAAQSDADPDRVFLAGLAHHLHNAQLPDAGFAGEVSLGASLDPLVRRLTDAELASLSPPVRSHVADALALVGDAETAEGRAFNAADVIDRVVQQHCHERAYRFSAGTRSKNSRSCTRGRCSVSARPCCGSTISCDACARQSAEWAFAARHLRTCVGGRDERWPVFDGVPFLRADRARWRTQHLPPSMQATSRAPARSC